MTDGRIPKMERITVMLFGAVYVFQGTYFHVIPDLHNKN